MTKLLAFLAKRRGGSFLETGKRKSLKTLLDERLLTGAGLLFRNHSWESCHTKGAMGKICGLRSLSSPPSFPHYHQHQTSPMTLSLVKLEDSMEIY